MKCPSNSSIESATELQNARAAYTAKESAAKLAVSVKTIYRFVQRGLLPASKASRQLLIAAHAVENFMEETK